MFEQAAAPDLGLERTRLRTDPFEPHGFAFLPFVRSRRSDDARQRNGNHDIRIGPREARSLADDRGSGMAAWHQIASVIARQRDCDRTASPQSKCSPQGEAPAPLKEQA
jgi:hypothetical protein